MNKTARCGGLLMAAALLPFWGFAEDCTVLAESGVVERPLVLTNSCLLQAVGSGSKESGRAVYRFTVTNGGSFVLRALVAAPGGQTNSLLINIDAEPEQSTMTWEVAPTVGFTNQIVFWQGDPVPKQAPFRRKVFSLSRGEHQLLIRGGSGTVQLARISVLELPPPPSGLRLVTGPGP